MDGQAARRRCGMASVVLPLGMTVLPQLDEVLQRLMFAVAYAWYAREAVAQLVQRSHGAGPTHSGLSDARRSGGRTGARGSSW